MDKFPETFSRQECNKMMEKCQLELIKSVRQKFYDDIQSAVQDCTQIVTLVFPDKLWNEHRKTLILELFEKFGKIIVQEIGIQDTKRFINNETDITRMPSNIKYVTIDFMKGS